jgi:hypothetical protein
VSETHPDPVGGVRTVDGPVLRALLDDVLPSGSRVLVLGPHGADVVGLLTARAAAVTTLDHLPLGDPEPAERYDVVLAAAGLDAVPAPGGTAAAVPSDEAESLGWAERLEAVAHVAAPGAVIAIGLSNDFVLSGLLDRTAVASGVPEDPSRPSSAADLAAELARVGLPAARVFAAASAGAEPRALIDVTEAARTRPGRLAVRVAAQALEAAAAGTPLLAPLADAADAAAQAGLLGSTLSGWLAVSGPTGGRSLYARIPGHDTVLAADRSRSAEGQWDLRVSPGEVETDPSTPVVFDVEAIPASIPDGVSVEHALLRLAAAEDIPGFRALAASLGAWTRRQYAGRQPTPKHIPVWIWDELVVDGAGFAPGVSPWMTAKSEAAADLLAAAWHRFHDRLVAEHRHHPWPSWTVGDDLVSSWLDMSGVKAGAAQVDRGRELAAAIGKPPAPAEVDLRTALTEAEEARREATDLASHIDGLERALAYRDKQLQVRENRIRRLRAELQVAASQRDKVNADRRRIRSSRTYKLAKQLRRATLVVRPAKLAATLRARANRGPSA